MHDVWGCTCQSTYMEVRKQGCAVGSLYPPLHCFWGLNSGCQACVESIFNYKTSLLAPEIYFFFVFICGTCTVYECVTVCMLPHAYTCGGQRSISGTFMTFHLLLFETWSYYVALAWSSLCKPNWSQIQSSDLCLLSTGTKSTCEAKRRADVT